MTEKTSRITLAENRNPENKPVKGKKHMDFYFDVNLIS
jgi:hypothetical protein